jgi:hypothetical protein
LAGSNLKSIQEGNKMTAAEILAAVRQNLKEATELIWQDEELALYQAQVLREMATHEGLLKRANLAVVQYTPEFDISPLTYFRVLRVEYPVGTAQWRQFNQFGSIVSMDLATVPDITSGTLAGTVTFTAGSRTISGSGTLFTTELSAGDLIGHHSGTKYYQIAYITSNTSLTLVEPFEETTATDTVSTTKYRDSSSCARVHYTGGYTVSTASDLPLKYDEILKLGIVANAVIDLSQTKANAVNIGDQAFASLKSWGNDKYAEYKMALKTMGRMADGMQYNFSRD